MPLHVTIKRLTPLWAAIFVVTLLAAFFIAPHAARPAGGTAGYAARAIQIDKETAPQSAAEKAEGTK